MPRKGQRADLAIRFWNKVTPLDKDHCWAWQGKRTEGGYGHIRYMLPSGNWSHVVAHRVSWELHNGQIPAGMLVLHRCDNPPCINPNHLFLGTHTDNARDREAKNRGGALAGDKHPFSKLTSRDVLEIRSSTKPLRYFAEKFGVSIPTVCDVRKGRTWNHIPLKAA